MGFDKERQVMGAGAGVEMAVIEKAKRTVALREEMSLDERYEVMEMLGLVGDGTLDLVRSIDMHQWNTTHGKM